MTDRRAFITGLATAPLIALPVAAQAATGVLCQPVDATNEIAAWRRLQEEEREAMRTFDAACEALSDAQERYFALRPAQPVCEIHTEIMMPNGQPYTYSHVVSRADIDRPGGAMFKDPRYAHYRDEWDVYIKSDDAAQRESGVDDADRLETLTMKHHESVLCRIWAFPTSNPAIIAEKLKLAIREYGNDNEHLSQIADAILITGGSHA